MLIESRHELSYGFTASRSSRLIALIIIGVVGTPASFAAGLMLGLVIAFSISAGGRMGAELLIAIALGLAGGGLFATWAVLNIMRVARTAAWLEGSWLTLRGVRSRTVDLSRASSVKVLPTTMRWRVAGREGMIPQLVVAGEDGGVNLRLSTGEGVPLPEQDVEALAAALSATNAPGATEASHYLRTEY